MNHVRRKYCNIVGCKYQNGTPQTNRDVIMFHMPLKGEKREVWIAAIENHQKFSKIDERSLIFNVCSEHFRDDQLKRSKGRYVTEGAPTIFPPIDIEMDHEKTNEKPIIEQTVENSQTTKSQEKKNCSLELQLSLALAKITHMKSKHQQQLFMLRSKLQTCKRECDLLRRKVARYEHKENKLLENDPVPQDNDMHGEKIKTKKTLETLKYRLENGVTVIDE